jgi:hypothetical protein
VTCRRSVPGCNAACVQDCTDVSEVRTVKFRRTCQVDVWRIQLFLQNVKWHSKIIIDYAAKRTGIRVKIRTECHSDASNLLGKFWLCKLASRLIFSCFYSVTPWECRSSGPRSFLRTQMRCEVLTAVKLSLWIFWVITPCGLVLRYRRFGRLNMGAIYFSSTFVIYVHSALLYYPEDKHRLLFQITT